MTNWNQATDINTCGHTVTCPHSSWPGRRGARMGGVSFNPLWKHFGHPWDERGLSNPSWRHWGFPLLDQAWMRAGCRGPKPGGIQASDGPAERGCQSEQAEGLKLLKQLPQDQEDHSPRLRERLLETQIWEEKEKDIMWDRFKSTIKPEPPALSLCLGIKNKTSYLDKDYVSVRS